MTFLISNAVGAIAWVATWVSVGYLAGDHIAAIYADVTRYAVYVAIAAVVVVLALGVIQLRRHRKRRADG